MNREYILTFIILLLAFAFYIFALQLCVAY